MKAWVAIVVFCALFTEPAFAHRIDEYLQATLLSVERDHVQVSMRLIPGVMVAPSVIDAIDSNHDGSFSESEERDYAQRVLADLSITVDRKGVQPSLGSWSFPQPAQLRSGLGEIHIEYSFDLPAGGSDRTLMLVNRHLRTNSVYLVNVIAPEDGSVRIVTQRRNEQQSVYELDFQQTELNFQQTRPESRTQWSNVRVWLSGLQLSSLFRLGMRHIAEGTDHLLFLLALLLPSPLLVSGLRWGSAAPIRRSLLHILGIVTAFTIGHSITLTVAALGFVSVSSRPVEVLIAVSIFVSAVHALRPIFPGREAFVAGFFGLIHGWAFAATLGGLGLTRWDRVAGILSFNLGIEAMQMLVVVAILPSLLLMSRTRAYPVLRISGALFAGTASLGWISERLLGAPIPVDNAVNAIAHYALWGALLLFALSFMCWLLLSPLGKTDHSKS